jgi:hypothetical protein
VIKVKLVCDGCAAVIGDGISAINVRVEAQGCYQRREGRDLCLVCAALPPNGQTSARRKYWGTQVLGKTTRPSKTSSVRGLLVVWNEIGHANAMKAAN